MVDGPDIATSEPSSAALLGRASTASGTSQPANVGIIGAGNISDFYLRIAKGFDNFRFTAIADLDPERAAAKADAHGVRPATVAELLADDSLDVVVNLTACPLRGALRMVLLARPVTAEPVTRATGPKRLTSAVR